MWRLRPTEGNMTEYIRGRTIVTAWIKHVTDDQGGGMGYCSACNTSLGGDPLRFPKICPSCKYPLELSEEGLQPYQGGGSDF